ncbi:restriction endonuclease subunit S [Phaeobacter sp. B1627]|uniref:restriction endonuclease subunit S n=1 Tax=Phaeobacter sp. B1627 TaxID=2583809 RepID=UPI001119A122|nr:restriction endonuclease subunit S [Phaeobacter sp. B1627]TNJ39596.1 restriction endonuclease subunit S [Phaeobacter sp. B1627]
MNAERLLEVYEQISEAPDAIARLRRFVLDLAVRGKLVEPILTEGNGAELARLIAADKAEKEKAGLIKPAKAPKGATREIGLEIPEHWHALLMVDVLDELQTGPFGSSLKKSDYAVGGVPVINPASIVNEAIRPVAEMAVGANTLDRLASFKLQRGDIVMARRGEMGRCALVDETEAGWLCGTGSLILRPSKLLFAKYLVLLIGSPYSRHYLAGSAVGATMQNLNQSILLSLPIGLPPEPEQHRIVAKVDELMALCDRLEEVRTTREEVRDKLTAASLACLTAPDTSPENFAAHARFALEALPPLTTRPDQIKTLRQTILNLAVHGKLVEQDPADEPASQLVKRIEDQREEYLAADYPNPSEAKTQRKKQKQQIVPPGLPALPDGWCWTTLQQSSLMVIDCKNKTAPYSDKGIRLIRTTNVRDGKMNSNDQKFVTEATYEAWSLRGKPQPGDILITREAPMGEVCIIPEGEKICLGQRMMLARLVPDTIDPRFMLYSLRDPNLMERVQDKPLGMTVQHLRVGGVETLLVALPPLSEQHRIVAKLDALMNLCDQLEAALTTTDTTRTRLLEALLKEALEPASEVLEAAE